MILKLYLLLFLCFLLKTYRMEAQTVKWNLQECIKLRSGTQSNDATKKTTKR